MRRTSSKKLQKLYIADNGYQQGYFCQTFYIELDWPLERFQPQASEVAQVRWFTSSELLHLMQTSPAMFTANFPMSANELMREVERAKSAPLG